MAQSSLSQFLSTMEANLGYRLFIRQSNGVRPTEAGRIMIRYAYNTISEFHRVQDEMQDITDLKQGKSSSASPGSEALTLPLPS